MERVVVTGGSGFIGTNLINSLLTSPYAVLNLDKAAPKDLAQASIWQQLDILDFNALARALTDFSPTVIIHLAAVTDLNGKTREYYKTNTEGVTNLIRVAASLPMLRRVLFTSSMYVCQPGHIPRSYDEYQPHTLYGESKVEGELAVKNNPSARYEWVIIRPTSIWGPWFGVPYIDFFHVVYQGRYYNFGSTCVKTYGYVENTVYQFRKLIEASAATVHGQTFYLGDQPPIPIAEWATEISREMKKGEVKKIPFFAIKAAAYVGDVLANFGVKFPMTSFRLTNMQTDNVLPLDALYAIVGPVPVTRIAGVKHTVNWLREHKGYIL